MISRMTRPTNALINSIKSTVRGTAVIRVGLKIQGKGYTSEEDNGDAFPYKLYMSAIQSPCLFKTLNPHKGT